MPAKTNKNLYTIKDVYSLRPIYDRIIVQRVRNKKMVGRIHLPGQGEKANMGQVIAIGTGRMLSNGDFVAPSVAVGDFVAFGKYDGAEFPEYGEGVLVLREADILAVIS